MYILNFKFLDTLSQKSAEWAYKKQSNKKDGMEPVLELIQNIKHKKYASDELTKEDWLKKFEYDFKATYGAVIKAGLLLSTAWLLDILIPTLVVTACFGIIRVFSGGLHFPSYTVCIYSFLATVLCIGGIGSVMMYNWIINLIIFLIVFINIIVFAPVEHPNRPFKEGERTKFRKTAIINTSIVFVISLITQYPPVSLGALLAGIIVLPVFNKRHN
jgi:accessory gene regulator B